MRWKGIIFLGILAAIILILSILFMDTWLEDKIESVGTSLNGARVEIDNLKISLTELFVRWDRLQITDPKNTMKNRIETGKCDFDFEVLPLLSKKLIIESFTITDIRTNTPRTTDGGIKKDSKQQTSGFIKNTLNHLEKEVSSIVSPQLTALKQKANIDSILSVLDLQSPQKMTALRQNIDTTYSLWEKRLSDLTIKDDLKQVENKIKSIDVNKIKTADQVYATLKEIDDVHATINTSSNLLSETKKEFTSDLNQIKNKIARVDDWIADDYAKAFSLAKIPDINAENIGKLIFGNNVVNRVKTYLDYAAIARKYSHRIGSDSDTQKEKSPPRLKGQDIYFYNKNARPDFWVKKINISGQTEGALAWEGLATNIVSDQRQIGKTTDISVKGKSSSGVQLDLNGILDYLNPQPSESFEVNYSGFSLANYPISTSRMLPNKIKNGSGSIKTSLDLDGDAIQGKISFLGRSLQFEPISQKESANQLVKIVQSIIKDISEVDFTAIIEGQGENLHFSVHSNLDDILVKKMGSIVSEEVEKRKREIKQRIDNEIGKYRADLEKLIADKQGILSGKLDGYETLLNDQTKLADSKKKEIEQKYEKEKSKIEKQVKDLLKF